MLSHGWLQSESPLAQVQWSHDQVDTPSVWKYLLVWVMVDVSEPRQGSWVPSNDFRLHFFLSIEYHYAELRLGYPHRLWQGVSEREGQKVKRRSQQYLVLKKECKKLDQEKIVELHNIVANTLYATKKLRPDTYTAISFLTMRVWPPDEDDWAKLVHMMQYIRGKINLSLAISSNGSGILNWWVDS